MIRSPDCQHSEWISCFLCRDTAKGECSLLSVAGQLQSIGTVSCVSLCRSLLKNTWWYCLRETEAHPPWGCWCLDIIHVSFAVDAALIVYQESRTQSTVWGSVPLKRWPRKSVPTVQWMPLSMVCILRGTKGINKSVLCVLPCCELPFNTFPRAVLEKRYRGPEMENNILNRPSAHVLFSVMRERMRARQRERERETSMTFKIHRGEMLPSGPSRSLSLRAISCIQCSLTVSRELWVRNFWYHCDWTRTKRCFLSQRDDALKGFLTLHFSSHSTWMTRIAVLKLHQVHSQCYLSLVWFCTDHPVPKGRSKQALPSMSHQLPPSRVSLHRLAVCWREVWSYMSWRWLGCCSSEELILGAF